MKKVVFLLFIVFYANSFSQKLEGQKLIDSLLVELPKMKEDSMKASACDKISRELLNTDLEKSIKFIDLQFQVSNKIKNKNYIASSFVNYAFYNLHKNELSNCKKYLIKAQKLNPSKTVLAELYKCYGGYFYYQSDFTNAIQNYNKSISIFESIGQKEGQSNVLLNIGSVYLQLKEYEKAIVSFKKSFELDKQINPQKQNGLRYYSLIGVCYLYLKDYDTAKLYFEKALKFKNIKDLSTLEMCYTGIGEIYLNTKKYDEAQTFIDKAKEISIKTDNKFTLSVNYFNLGEISYYKSKIDGVANIDNKYLNKSTEFYQKAIDLGKEIDNDLLNYDTYSKLSRNLKLQGNFKASLEAHEQYVIYKDSIFNADNKETIKNLEDKREIELRDNKLKINQLELKSKEKQKWYLFAGLGLLTVIGGLLFYQSRKRKQINSKLETLNQNLDAKNLELDQANKAKTRFFGILNHDLRGPVANLVFFLQLQQESPEMLDPESIKRMQDKTMTGAENLLTTMEDILQWSKSQMENFKPQPKNIPVEQLFNDTKKVFSGYLKISFEYQNPENIDVFTDENYLKTIIRNLTSNAINVFTNTENPKIIWKAWQENNVPYFSIQDNGPGASQEQFKTLFEDTEITSAKSGLGLYLIRDMTKAINCEISVDSKIGEGTTFTLKI